MVLNYTTLFDAIVDAIYFALEKVSYPDVSMMVLEIGWPSASSAVGATGENAMTYHNNVVVYGTTSMGTAKRSGKAIETYLPCLMRT